MWTSPFSSKIKIRNSYSNLPEQIVMTTETHFIPEHIISFSFKRFVGTEGKRLSHYQLLAWNFLARTRYNFPIVNFLQFYNWTHAWRFVSLFEADVPMLHKFNSFSQNQFQIHNNSVHVLENKSIFCIIFFDINLLIENDNKSLYVVTKIRLRNISIYFILNEIHSTQNATALKTKKERKGRTTRKRRWQKCIRKMIRKSPKVKSASEL